MISIKNPILARTARWATRGALAAGVLTASTACSVDKILSVKDVDVATPASLKGATALPILLGGAVATFHATYIGTGNVNESSGQIGYSGLLSDELRSSDTFPTRNQVDQRNIQLDNSSNEAQFILLSQARASADRASSSYQQFGADQSGMGLAYALAGYTRVLFGENYCSGVPLSTLTEGGATEYGKPLTTAEMFQGAIAKFDTALAASAIVNAAASDTATRSIKYLALVGKARAQLDLGQYADAAATAQLVATPGWRYNVSSSITTSGEYNGMYTFNQNTQRLTLVDKEGINGLDFLSSGDSIRVKWVDAKETGFDNSTPLYLQQKYTTRSSPAVLASYIEAQLIVAEADYQAGNYLTGALPILNALRTSAGLTPLAAAATPAAQVDQIFRERAFWMYLTSHRLGDLRRLVRQYTRGAETVFPTGAFFKGGSYGPDVNMPVPEVEKNNPNFHGCIDRNA